MPRAGLGAQSTMIATNYVWLIHRDIHWTLEGPLNVKSGSNNKANSRFSFRALVSFVVPVFVSILGSFLSFNEFVAAHETRPVAANMLATKGTWSSWSQWQFVGLENSSHPSHETAHLCKGQEFPTAFRSHWSVW